MLRLKPLGIVKSNINSLFYKYSTKTFVKQDPSLIRQLFILGIPSRVMLFSQVSRRQGKICSTLLPVRGTKNGVDIPADLLTRPQAR